MLMSERVPVIYILFGELSALAGKRSSRSIGMNWNFETLLTVQLRTGHN